MSRSSLYFVIAALVAVVVAFAAYTAYQQSQQPSLQIRVDEQGIKVDGNG